MLRRTIAFFVGVSIALTLLVSLPSINAQNAAGAGNGLQISPTRTELSGSKGEQKSFSIQLKNITQVDLTIKAVLNDFESDDATGTPKIIVDTSVRTPYSLADMLKGLQDVDLKAGETKELEFSVDIPSNAVAGAYFGAIRYQVVPNDAITEDENNRQVALNASVAHLVFVEVPGEISEQISIESIKAQRGETASSFFFQSPDKAAITVKNLGNGFSRPFGKVDISYFGKEVYGYDLNDKDTRGIILPSSTRTFTDEIKNVNKPGKYTITAAVAYGNGGEVVTYTTSFWYMPVWIFIVLLALIGIIAAASRMIYRRKFAPKKRR